MFVRILSAIVALPLLFISVIYNQYIFFGALCIITITGLYEYFTAVKNSNTKPMMFIGMLSGIILLFLTLSKTPFDYIVPLITFIILIMLSMPVFFKQYSFLSAGITIIGVLYVSLFFGYLYLIRSIPEKGVYLIWFVFIASWITDTAAYFSGMAFGKTKLCPSVSPKKTVEGSVGGTVASCICCTIYGILLNRWGILHISYIYYIVMGILASIISQVGDLTASSIKRNVGIKDYGKIMPGHGGLLDRFDSILYVAPLIYYYITYIFY